MGSVVDVLVGLVMEGGRGEEVKPWMVEKVRCFCMQGRDEEVSGYCTVPVRCYCEG